MPWKQVIIPDKEEQKRWQLEEEFKQIFISSGSPIGAVMRGGRDPFAKNHRLFFSPLAARLAADLLRRYGAEDCNRPPKGETPFLVGNESDKEFG